VEELNTVSGMGALSGVKGILQYELRQREGNQGRDKSTAYRSLAATSYIDF
jgi:hypothetical protein